MLKSSIQGTMSCQSSRCSAIDAFRRTVLRASGKTRKDDFEKTFLNNSCNDVIIIWVGPGGFQTDLLFSISCYQGQPEQRHYELLAT